MTRPVQWQSAAGEKKTNILINGLDCNQLSPAAVVVAKETSLSRECSRPDPKLLNLSLLLPLRISVSLNHFITRSRSRRLTLICTFRCRRLKPVAARKISFRPLSRYLLGRSRGAQWRAHSRLLMEISNKRFFAHDKRRIDGCVRGCDKRASGDNLVI